VVTSDFGSSRVAAASDFKSAYSYTASAARDLVCQEVFVDLLLKRCVLLFEGPFSHGNPNPRHHFTSMENATAYFGFAFSMANVAFKGGSRYLNHKV
jgi:hypothetical protein